jgi:poly-gamma-glutamate synthesis protein (capsule biosynthesis protein)
MKRPLALSLWMLIALLGLVPFVPPDQGAPTYAAAAPARVQVPHLEAAPTQALPPRRGVPSRSARPVAEDDMLHPALFAAGTSAPQPYLLALDRGAAPARLAQALQRDVARDGHSVQRTVSAGQADLYIGYDPPPGFITYPLTATRFVPVVSYWLPVTEVAYADLERIFHGEVQTWADLGAPVPEKVMRLALQTDPLPPLSLPAGPLLPDAATLVAALDRLPGGIALVPLDQVDPRMRTLRVDGRDPLLEEQVAPGDPLVRRLYIAVAPNAPVGAAARAQVLAGSQRVAPPEPAIEIVVVGDVMPGRLVGRLLAGWGDYTCPFSRVDETLGAADLTIANLEGALSDEIAPPVERQTMLFVGNGRFVEGLRYAGIDAVSLANNHSRNFGTAGISDTLALLSAAGIGAFGAGMDLAAARRPAVYEVRGVRFAFLGYDAVSSYYAAEEERAGTAPADPKWIAADIAAAREQADVVIPYFHWGVEYTHQANTSQKGLAHLAVEAGAAVVLGSHPHWVQGLEYYQGSPIVYSLGNFVFDQRLSQETRQGMITHLIFRGHRLVGLRLQAVQIEEYYQPAFLPPEPAGEVYRHVQESSPSWTHQKGAQP